MNRRTVQLILTLFLIGTIAGAVYGSHLFHKSPAEIYSDIPLGKVEIDIEQMFPIESTEAREDHLGEIRVWRHSNDTDVCTVTFLLALKNPYSSCEPSNDLCQILPCQATVKALPTVSCGSPSSSQLL